jgi:hypothetical protein
MENPHVYMLNQIEVYKMENERFTEKGIKSAGTKARKALAENGKCVKLRRKEIQESKNQSKG